MKVLISDCERLEVDWKLSLGVGVKKDTGIVDVGVWLTVGWGVIVSSAARTGKSAAIRRKQMDNR
jgi:hypothetical protein